MDLSLPIWCVMLMKVTLSVPVKQQPICMNPINLEASEKEVEYMLDNGIIEPIQLLHFTFHSCAKAQW